jgi:hypothetical protein
MGIDVNVGSAVTPGRVVAVINIEVTSGTCVKVVVALARGAVPSGVRLGVLVVVPPGTGVAVNKRKEDTSVVDGVTTSVIKGKGAVVA